MRLTDRQLLKILRTPARKTHLPLCKKYSRMFGSKDCICILIEDGDVNEENLFGIPGKLEKVKAAPKSRVKKIIEKKPEESVSALIERARQGDGSAFDELRRKLNGCNKSYLIKNKNSPKDIIQAAEVVFEILPTRTALVPVKYKEEEERSRKLFIVGANDEMNFLKQMAYWARMAGWVVEISAYEMLGFTITDVLVVFKRQVPDDAMVKLEGVVQAKVYGGTKATSENDFINLLKYFKRKLRDVLKNPV